MTVSIPAWLLILAAGVVIGAVLGVVAFLTWLNPFR